MMGRAKPKAMSEAELAAYIRDVAFEVFAHGAWFETVDDESCPDPGDLFLNATVGVLRLLFILADSKSVAPEVVMQAVGYAVGDRARPQDGDLQAHARRVMLGGFIQGVTGDTIGQTEGRA